MKNGKQEKSKDKEHKTQDTSLIINSKISRIFRSRKMLADLCGLSLRQLYRKLNEIGFRNHGKLISPEETDFILSKMGVLKQPP